jgi:DNA-damage-inducible protein D
MPEDQNSNDLTIFEQKQVRRIWHKGEWYYSITDVISILTDSKQPRAYWGMLKNRAQAEEGVELILET